MAEMTEAYEWSGRSVLDTDGEKVGTIERIYRSLETEQPEWALVDRGLFGAAPRRRSVGHFSEGQEELPDDEREGQFSDTVEPGDR